MQDGYISMGESEWLGTIQRNLRPNEVSIQHEYLRRFGSTTGYQISYLRPDTHKDALPGTMEHVIEYRERKVANQVGLRNMNVQFDKQISDTRTDFMIRSAVIDVTNPQNTLSNRAYKLYVFKDLVKSNAPYDLKKHGYSQRDIGTYSLYHGQKFRYDDYGNYNYGVAAKAYGISLDEAIRAAGIFQVYSGTGFFSNPSGWFDDPRDTQMIINGYNHNFKQ